MHRKLQRSPSYQGQKLSLTWVRLKVKVTVFFNPKLSGKSADLVCKVENGKEYPINWIKISGDKKEDYEYFPLSTGKTLAIRDQRFNLR